jgi:hypothetical protein
LGDLRTPKEEELIPGLKPEGYSLWTVKLGKFCEDLQQLHRNTPSFYAQAMGEHLATQVKRLTLDMETGEFTIPKKGLPRGMGDDLVKEGVATETDQGLRITDAATNRRLAEAAIAALQRNLTAEISPPPASLEAAANGVSASRPDGGVFREQGREGGISAA